MGLFNESEKRQIREQAPLAVQMRRSGCGRAG
jgi:hypothetical protein